MKYLLSILLLFLGFFAGAATELTGNTVHGGATESTCFSSNVKVVCIQFAVEEDTSNLYKPATQFQAELKAIKDNVSKEKPDFPQHLRPEHVIQRYHDYSYTLHSSQSLEELQRLNL